MRKLVGLCAALLISTVPVSAFDIKNSQDQTVFVSAMYNVVDNATEPDSFGRKAWRIEVEFLDFVMRTRAVGDVELAMLKKAADCFTEHFAIARKSPVIRHARADLAKKLVGKRTFACNLTKNWDMKKKS